MRSGARHIRLAGLGDTESGITGTHGTRVLPASEVPAGYDAAAELKSAPYQEGQAYWNRAGSGVRYRFGKPIKDYKIVKRFSRWNCSKRTDSNALQPLSHGYSVGRVHPDDVGVWGGCHMIIAVKYEGGGLEGQYRVERNKIKDFMRKIDTGAVACNAPLPAEINQNLQAPGVDDSEAIHKAYNEYRAYLTTELDFARQACAASGTGSGGSHTSPGTVNPPDAGTPSGGGGSAIVPGEDIYADYNEYGGYADPYAEGGSREGGTVVPNPFAPPTPVAADEPGLVDLSTTKGKAIAGGGALALGVLAFAILRRRKKRKKSKR